MLYFVHIPDWLKRIFPSILWEMERDDPAVYLTFDDGPNPETTPEILKILAKHQAKASFFVLGNSALQHPELIRQIKSEGHCLAFHGIDHLDGYKTSIKKYLENTKIPEDLPVMKYFRPPYGRIRIRQLKKIQKYFKVVLWTHMPGDFDEIFSTEEVLERMKYKCDAGSIIVLHEHPSGIKSITKALDSFITEKSLEGIQFKALP